MDQTVFRSTGLCQKEGFLVNDFAVFFKIQCIYFKLTLKKLEISLIGIIGISSFFFPYLDAIPFKKNNKLVNRYNVHVVETEELKVEN